MSVGTVMGNTLGIGVATIAISPASVAANTSAEQTFPLPGVRLRDAIAGVSKPSAQMGLALGNWRVSADDTIAITFINATASPIVPTAAEQYRVTWVRTDAVQTGLSI